MITLTPKDEGSQSGLIVLSHGLGDTAEGLLDLGEYIAKKLPHVKVVLPTAPTQPVTMNMGMSMPSWYDITGLDERSNEQCKGILQSRDTIRNIIDTEHTTLQLPYNRMVLMGFSQGGALSLFTGMQLPSTSQKLAGIVIMSGYLPAKSQFTITDGFHSTPILHCHGEEDPLVQLGMAQRTKQVLESMGSTQYTMKTYTGMAHSTSVDEINDVVDFVSRILPMDVEDTCKVTLKDPTDMSIKELRASIRNAGLTSNAIGFMEKREFVKLLQDYRQGKL